MFEAQLLQAPSTVYSPWFPRGGCSITATLDVVEIEGDDTIIKVEVFTKPSEDAGPGSNADVGTDIQRSGTDGPGRSSETWAGEVNDLVRYKFDVTNDMGLPGWVLFRMLPPLWFDSVKA